MFLKYLWIKEYGCLKNAEFQFDRNIEFIYDAERNLLKAKEYKSILSDNFWSESGRIEDIHALVGDNGRGKTTFLRAVMDIFTQLYSGEQPDKEVTLANVPFQAIMIIKKANELQYQVLCFGMKGLNIDSQLLHKIRVVDDLLEVRRVLSTVKIAFFPMFLI